MYNASFLVAYWICVPDSLVEYAVGKEAHTYEQFVQLSTHLPSRTVVVVGLGAVHGFVSRCSLNFQMRTH